MPECRRLGKRSPGPNGRGERGHGQQASTQHLSLSVLGFRNPGPCHSQLKTIAQWPLPRFLIPELEKC